MAVNAALSLKATSESDSAGGTWKDLILVLGFIYISGIIAGILGTLLTQGIFRKIKNDRMGDDPPRDRPEPLHEGVRARRVPQKIVVGWTDRCYAYHSVSANDCTSVQEMKDHGRTVKAYSPCKCCFPAGISPHD